MSAAHTSLSSSSGLHGHPLLRSPIGTIMSESGVQQGDPLGPLFVLFGSAKSVISYASDPICFNLSFHAWYIDDGVIAGQSKPLCRHSVSFKILAHH